MQEALAVLCGVVVGFSLGLTGGGGSILALPLLIYVVGIDDPHIAIGTSALAVAVNALLNLIHHARSGNVLWPEALLFGAFGVGGAFLGSTAGKAFDGQKLLALFALMMLVAAALMFLRRHKEPEARRALGLRTGLRLGFTGLGTGGLSGFFGIGGGFMCVPGLMTATGMPIIRAVGSSLFAVGMFGLTTAANYGWSGLIAYRIAGFYVLGGFFGGWIGARLARRMSRGQATYNIVFAGLLVAGAIYIFIRSLIALGLIFQS